MAHHMLYKHNSDSNLGLIAHENTKYNTLNLTRNKTCSLKETLKLLYSTYNCNIKTFDVYQVW